MSKILLKKYAGNTLFECCIVIALIALVCSLYIYHSRLFTGMCVQSEVDILYTTIEQLKQRALSMHKKYTLVFNLKGPPGSSTKIIDDVCTFVHNTIHFSCDGVVSSGTVYIADKDKNYCYALSNAVSSYAKILRYILRNNIWQKQ